MRILVTGGSGFIGSALIRHLIAESEHEVLNVDKLTYAATPAALTAEESNPRYRFLQADICDPDAVRTAFAEFQPDGVVHLAAETHVDRSIDAPESFVETNVLGTYRLLEEATRYIECAPSDRRDRFRFHHVSTDEVFGSLGPEGRFSESAAYDPRSPYAASKAGSDHLVRAWAHTYGLSVLLTNSSNNYGPYQFPEKLIPLMLLKALSGQQLPIYGRGENVRDWLHVEDHVRALLLVFENGRRGESYNIGASFERTNLQVVERICELLDHMRPRPDGRSYREQIGFVADRPGHDLRYAIDASKLSDELGWSPELSFESGLAKTISWYLANEAWLLEVQTHRYGGQRLGLARTE